MADSRTDGHVSSIDEIKGYSGLDFLQRIASGEVAQPPIGWTLGFRLAEVRPGFALFTMTPLCKHYNPIGTVHGGVASTLLDSCMSCAIQTHLEKGFGYTTLELNVNFVKGLSDRVPLVRAIGDVIHSGSRVATAEGRLVRPDGTLYAHATTTCLIFESR